MLRLLLTILLLYATINYIKVFRHQEELNATKSIYSNNDFDMSIDDVFRVGRVW